MNVSVCPVCGARLTACNKKGKLTTIYRFACGRYILDKKESRIIGSSTLKCLEARIKQLEQLLRDNNVRISD